MLILFLLSIELLDRDTSEKETSKREREREGGRINGKGWCFKFPLWVSLYFLRKCRGGMMCRSVYKRKLCHFGGIPAMPHCH
jgi:hypothetical protein